MSGCHDTTLAAILCSLGAFDGEKWPPYTSHIAVELFRKDDEVVSSTAALKEQQRPRMLSFGATKKNDSTQGGIARRKFEELSDAEKQKLRGFYVRLRYNDRPVTIPGCRLPGKHLEGNQGFCTLVFDSYPQVCGMLIENRKNSKPSATNLHRGTGRRLVIRTSTDHAFPQKWRTRASRGRMYRRRGVTTERRMYDRIRVTIDRGENSETLVCPAF